MDPRSRSQSRVSRGFARSADESSRRSARCHIEQRAERDQYCTAHRKTSTIRRGSIVHATMSPNPARMPSTDSAADPNRDGSAGGKKGTAVPSLGSTTSAEAKTVVGANTDQAQAPTATAKKSTAILFVDPSSSTEGGADGAAGMGEDAVLSPTDANPSAKSGLWENGLKPDGSPETEMAGPAKSATTGTRAGVTAGQPVATVTRRPSAEEEKVSRRDSCTRPSMCCISYLL